MDINKAFFNFIFNITVICDSNKRKRTFNKIYIFG